MPTDPEYSILKSLRKLLLIADDDPTYDLDVITHANSAFSTLAQLGVEPPGGFVLTDESQVWSDFLPDLGPNQEMIRSYVYMYVRKIFDPPTTSYLVDSIEKQIAQFEYRISVNRESFQWVDPEPTPPPIVIDGGSSE